MPTCKQSCERAVRLTRQIAVAGVALAVIVATPALAQDATGGAKTYSDPLEQMNRGIFFFNQAVDNMLMKPVARVYIKTVPDKGRAAVSNFINNLKTPVTLVNDLLQGDLDRAQATIARFMVNTILGFGGMADVAADLGVPYHSEDFGQTVATYGIGSGPYLMLPLLGPSNFRDAAGRVIDSFFDPLEYALNSDESLARAGMEGLDQRARYLDVSEAMEKTSIDYYASIRSVFTQNRAYEIRNGEPEPVIDIYSDQSN